MRFATTALVAAAVLALGLVGCATDNGDAEAPTTVPSTEEANAAKAGDDKAGRENEKPATPRPDFEPEFDETTTPAETTDPSKDPTPPGGENQCIDNDDAGSSPNRAKALAETDDCNQDIRQLSGVINGGVDVDYYSVSAKDKFGCKLDTIFETKTAGTELCVFARCQNSTENAVTGCEEGTETTDTNGMKGCCAAAPGNGKAIPKWDCSGVTDNDSADFFLRVKQTNNGEKCLPYKIDYRY